MTRYMVITQEPQQKSLFIYQRLEQTMVNGARFQGTKIWNSIDDSPNSEKN